MSSPRAVVLVLFLALYVVSSPLTPTSTRNLFELDSPSRTVVKRTDPTFPPSPPSCPICAQGYPSIASCAEAAPVLANFSQIIFSPGKFISVIECACTDTFKSVFPQCVDCFQQTNQTDVISSAGNDLPSILTGLRNICAVASTLLGNVTSANGEQVNGTPIAVPPPSGALTNVPSSSFILLINVVISIVLVFACSSLL